LAHGGSSGDCAHQAEGLQSILLYERAGSLDYSAIETNKEFDAENKILMPAELR
jgi:hypothetical protein